MTRSLIVLLAALPCLAQESRPDPVAEKCDTLLDWIHDGAELRDREMRDKPVAPARDTGAVLDEARKKASAGGRLILWYVPRIEGSHMYRAALPDAYARIALFTHPEVAELIRRKFVPMRAMADGTLSAATGIRRFDVVEPAVVFLTSEGKPIRVVDRLRTFNSGWFIDVLRSVLAENAACNPVAEGASVDDLILGGDYDRAQQAGPDPLRSAAIARRRRLGDEALRLLQELSTSEAGVERGRTLLSMGRLSDAKEALEGALKGKNERAPEALHHIALIEYWSGSDEGADRRWRELARKHPRSPWAWMAASNLVPDPDTLRRGPAAHGFEDPFWAPAPAYAATARSTVWPREESERDDLVRRAVGFLLRSQRTNGGWEDARYTYWPDPSILPNVRVAVTALASAALLEWRASDPDRIDAALKRAEKYFLDEERMARGRNEEPYADAFKVLYFLKKAEANPSEKRRCTAVLSEVGRRLAASQKRSGFWAHEYPNPFCTAAILHLLHRARGAGARIDDAMLAKAAEAIESTRGRDGAQAYSGERKEPSSLKDSMGRIVPCDHALFESGRKKVEDLSAAFARFWEHRDRLAKVRLCDFHSDGELAGFFFFHSLYFTSEAIASLPEADRAGHRERLRKWLHEIPELDGSFLDSHELGKSYGTAMALLTLKNVLEPVTK